MKLPFVCPTGHPTVEPFPEPEADQFGQREEEKEKLRKEKLLVQERFAQMKSPGELQGLARMIQSRSVRTTRWLNEV